MRRLFGYEVAVIMSPAEVLDFARLMFAELQAGADGGGAIVPHQVSGDAEAGLSFIKFVLSAVTAGVVLRAGLGQLNNALSVGLRVRRHPAGRGKHHAVVELTLKKPPPSRLRLNRLTLNVTRVGGQERVVRWEATGTRLHFDRRKIRWAGIALVVVATGIASFWWIRIANGNWQSIESTGVVSVAGALLVAGLAGIFGVSIPRSGWLQKTVAVPSERAMMTMLKEERTAYRRARNVAVRARNLADSQLRELTIAEEQWAKATEERETARKELAHRSEPGLNADASRQLAAAGNRGEALEHAVAWTVHRVVLAKREVAKAYELAAKEQLEASRGLQKLAQTKFDMAEDRLRRASTETRELAAEVSAVRKTELEIATAERELDERAANAAVRAKRSIEYAAPQECLAIPLARMTTPVVDETRGVKRIARMRKNERLAERRARSLGAMLWGAMVNVGDEPLVLVEKDELKFEGYMLLESYETVLIAIELGGKQLLFDGEWAWGSPWWTASTVSLPSDAGEDKAPNSDALATDDDEADSAADDE